MTQTISSLAAGGALPWLLGGAAALVALFLVRRTLGRIFRLFFRACVGLAGLFALSEAGTLLGVTLGVNLFNALVVALLGIPGVGLLILLQLPSLAA